MTITINIIEDTARAGLVRLQPPQTRKFSLSLSLSLSPKSPQISPFRERANARPRSIRGGARGQRAAPWVGSRDGTRRGTRGARVSLVLSSHARGGVGGHFGVGDGRFPAPKPEISRRPRATAAVLRPHPPQIAASQRKAVFFCAGLGV